MPLIDKIKMTKFRLNLIAINLELATDTHPTNLFTIL